MNMAEILHQTAEKQRQKPAVIFRGETLSYAALSEAAWKMASALKRLGIQRGDRVGLYMGNCPEFVISHFGILTAGAATVPMNPMYKGKEVEYILENSESKVLITTSLNYGVVEAIPRGKLQLANVIIVSDEGASNAIFYRDILTAPFERFSLTVDHDDVAAVCYTSGTTGRPKGAMLTNRNFISNIATLANVWQWTEHDIILASLPLTHMHGLGVVLHGTVYTGGTMVLTEKFDAQQALRLMEQYRCTLFMGVPAMYVKLLEVGSQMKPRLDSLRLFVSGSAPLPPRVFEQFKEQFGFEILERYGMTETIMNTSNPYHGMRKAGSAGLPLPNVELRIVDESNRDVSAGEVGEILLKGPNVMRGYWKMPQETASTFIDGWFRTGDLGRLDGDGYLIIVGRSKDMISVGGFKVYPREVEETLEENPKVKEAAIVGIPDETRGETVKAYVVLQPDAKASPNELIQFCRDRLATFKAPRAVEFVKALPRTSSGKVIKTALTSAQARELAPS